MFDEGGDEEGKRGYEEYHDPHLVNGTVLLSDLPAHRASCNILLVVSGPERGHIWVDDRVRGRGIYPLVRRGPYSLLAWLEGGLDYLLANIDSLYQGLLGGGIDLFHGVAARAFGLPTEDSP
jgi:hypothetical protein